MTCWPTRTASESPSRATRMAAGHALELQERDIGGRIGGEECRAHDLTADALDGDLVHAVDDVGGRHHPAVAGDQDTGARLVEAGDASRRRRRAPWLRTTTTDGLTLRKVSSRFWARAAGAKAGSTAAASVTARSLLHGP